MMNDYPLVIIGSQNPNKVRAVAKTLALYDPFKGSAITSIAAASKVSEQPKSLEETVRGAINRADACYHHASTNLTDNRYGFGIESGLMAVPFTLTGYMDFCVCAIIGPERRPIIGLSQAFECPPVVIDTVLKDETKTLNDGFVRLGVTDNPLLGYAEGAIGLLTRGRVSREQYTVDAIKMALIQLDFPDLYRP